MPAPGSAAGAAAGGAVAAILFLAVLLASAVIGLILIKKRRSPREGKVVRKRIGSSPSEQHKDIELAPYHPEQVGEPHYENTKSRQDCVDKVAEASFTGDYDVIDSADAPSKDTDVSRPNDEKIKNPKENQPTGTADVVYTAIDKSKKKKKGKTKGGPSATSTQGADIVEQHYECSEVFGQDWFGNEVGERSAGSHGDDGKGSSSSDAQHSGPQREPSNPNVVYTVVDKSKKMKNRKRH